MGEARKEALKLGFVRSVRLEFHGATVSSEGGLLAYRDLDDSLGLTAQGGASLALNWTRLSCHDFADNQVRLQLFALAYIPRAREVLSSQIRVVGSL